MFETKGKLSLTSHFLLLGGRFLLLLLLLRQISPGSILIVIKDSRSRDVDMLLHLTLSLRKASVILQQQVVAEVGCTYAVHDRLYLAGTEHFRLALTFLDVQAELFSEYSFVCLL